ncbi:hypothetical protein M409DRAFT_62806 [Zasmidium cellare ATCC 36951]|uniref:Inclusion body clearance protein IML2 n=1 Tax=Zasmidium cellare ATCC 36951 TaxID=1080233 RepID=A0A6A6D1K5_ZASCE|nr:uncharacterized protein M409DRAFT_62806 [Zasmidium cellare ATCC 36951]KAF2173241.1 hypothetical protein M409DRAFT_62806 [Zasmidium cellare ATCC 36951]
MKRVGGWLSSKTSLPATKSLTALDEPAALQDALKSAALIMNDENERAENELSKGTSPFHKLGRATTFFLRATLGFEKEMMEQTSSCLSEAEESASEHHRRATRDPTTAHQSKIYPTGSEYALCQAETQLMSAVIGVLNESLTESLRGFYKLRRAFATLHAIVEAENRYLDKHFSTSSSSRASTATEKSKSKRPYGPEEASAASSGVMTPTGSGDEEDLNFKDAEEGLGNQPTPVEYQGHIDLPVESLSINGSTKGSRNSKSSVEMPPAYASSISKGAAGKHDDLDFTADVSNDPIDVYIHSGISLCYGLLQLILSMVPPAFSRILSILSFRGDRENGLRLLWRATAFKDNINGALASAITLGFHNAAVALCDIHSRESYPKERLTVLLQDIRKLYPQSVMWVLEEARMAMAGRDLERGADILINNPLKSPLKQVEALRLFETSTALMCLHRYEECANCFIKCVDMNSWSPGLYLYIAGACHVELYRQYTLQENPEKASAHKKKATDLLNSVTQHAGKKRLMARQLPLDVFIVRKLAKWTARAKASSPTTDLVDAIGVSPLEEMIYFWSGFRRMRPEHVHLSLACLAWSETQHAQAEPPEPIDERAILALLTATCLRTLNRLAEAQATLTEKVYCYDWHALKACPHADNWPLPVAHYEHAVCLWQEAGGQDGEREVLRRCSEELGRVERWESFDLDARIGLKITTARETLRRAGV